MLLLTFDVLLLTIDVLLLINALLLTYYVLMLKIDALLLHSLLLLHFALFVFRHVLSAWAPSLLSSLLDRATQCKCRGGVSEWGVSLISGYRVHKLCASNLATCFPVLVGSQPTGNYFLSFPVGKTLGMFLTKPLDELLREYFSLVCVKLYCGPREMVGQFGL